MGETHFKEMLWRQWWSKKRFGGQGITDGGGEEEEEYLWKIQHDALLKGCSVNFSGKNCSGLAFIGACGEVY